VARTRPALVQLADADFCAIPLRYVTECLDDVGLPARYRPLLPVAKVAATVGLIAGLWIDHLGAVTAACVAAYFALVVAAHVRVGDIGRNMFNASVLLGFSVFVFFTFI
jgi:hypothetical protein